jgi:hypothetical protein
VPLLALLKLPLQTGVVVLVRLKAEGSAAA